MNARAVAVICTNLRAVAQIAVAILLSGVRPREGRIKRELLIILSRFFQVRIGAIYLDLVRIGARNAGIDLGDSERFLSLG